MGFEHGIELAILTRTGRLIGQITSPVTKNIHLRVEQFRKYEDEAFRLAFSKSIIGAKIKNGLRLVRTFSYNHPEIDLSTETDLLAKSVLKIEDAPDDGALLGIEGNAARTYFAAFAKMILGAFDFSGRKKRPPTDPVNAMLSLSYTMLFNEIASLLDGLGFDPYLGYFHKIGYGRASLTADLSEEFRAPIADRLVLKLINNRVFSDADFHSNPKGGGCYFNRGPLQRYFREYESFIGREFSHPDVGQKATLRSCIRKQAEKMARVIQAGELYQPFILQG